MGTCSDQTNSEATTNAPKHLIELKVKLARQQRHRMCQSRRLNALTTAVLSAAVLLVAVGYSISAAEEPAPAVPARQQPEPTITSVRSTQATIERQVDSPAQSLAQPTVGSAPASTISATANKAHGPKTATENSIAKATQRLKQQAINRKAAAMDSQQNYDKYQLKATNSNSHHLQAGAPSQSDSSAAKASDSSSSAAAVDQSKSSLSPSSSSATQTNESSSSANKQKVEESESSLKAQASSNAAQKKAAADKQQQGNRAKSSFALLKKLLPSFMTSAGPMAAAAAAAAASAVADSSSMRNQMSHSRSSPSQVEGLGSKVSGKILNLLSGSSKKSGNLHDSLFKPALADRQAGGFGAAGAATAASGLSSLLSNPLSLGLLFSAPLIPSLLLTPLAIAGLSPAMSAINNLFGDDDEPAAGSTAAPSALSVLTGPSSPLSSILQGNQASGSSLFSSVGGNSGSSAPNSLALQAMQSILGPPASTEKPLFNPGMFANQGIQNAIGSLSSGSSSSGASSSSSSASQQQQSPIRGFLGGNSLIQTAASMISPSFAAPPANINAGSGSSSSSAVDSDSDGPGFMQVASDVFDKVANYMGGPDKDIQPAASSLAGSSSSNSNSPISSLVGLSSFSPFQLSSLFAASPFGSALVGNSGAQQASGSSSSSSHHHHSSSHQPNQRAGFFTTLKNVYELFSSSFLKRQGDNGGDNSNECQQRLICELHQRAMNSKLFKRSIQANLMELATLDKNLQDQLKNPLLQARVDADTKAMLSDFLKATNNFKSGRELINCSKLFPKCSRLALLSTANAHLSDPNSSKAIGKFSSLMKKMKFKSAQQHQSQWKLRKANNKQIAPATMTSATKLTASSMAPQQYQASDYLQVAPLTSPSIKPQAGQLTPADSLKLVQQMMLMSQQQQQQQQQQQTFNQQYPSMYIPNSYNNYAPQQLPMTNVYTDAVGPQLFSPTESPYYSQPQSQSQNQPMSSIDLSQSQQQPSMMQQSQHQQPQQQYPTSTSMVPSSPAGSEHLASSGDSNKQQASGKLQQLTRAMAA